MKKVEIIEKLLYILLQKFVCMTTNPRGDSSGLDLTKLNKLINNSGYFEEQI